MTPVRSVIDALDAHDCNPRERHGRWVALCPSHDDHSPSLTVAEGDDGRALVLCRAGCPTPNVVAALDLTMADLFAESLNPMEAWNR